MSLQVDIQYARLVGYRLEQWKEKRLSPSYLSTFRCPICHDSEKKKSKKRGFFYSRDGKVNYYCHNCGASMRLSSFIRWFDPGLFRNYSLDTFGDKRKKVDDDYVPPPCKITFKDDPTDELKSLVDLPETHPAVVYAKSRQLPKKYWTQMFYAPKFFKWASGHTEKFNYTEGKEDHPRLILGWYTDKKELFAYSARAFGDEDPKYFIIYLDESHPKFFGMDRVDESRTVYVLEGQFDSMFIDNSVAVGDSFLQAYYNPKAVYIPDADVFNKEIMKNVRKMIEANLRVCLMPDMDCGKDINEMILSGLTSEEIKSIIDKHTYQGLKAQLEFTKWKRIAI